MAPPSGCRMAARANDARIAMDRRGSRFGILHRNGERAQRASCRLNERRCADLSIAAGCPPPDTARTDYGETGRLRRREEGTE